MITQLSQAGKSFASETNYGSSIELMSVMCYCDDDRKNKLQEMKQIFGSLKTIGPKNQSIMVQIPTNDQLKAMIR